MSVVRLPTFLDEKLAVSIVSEKNRLLIGRGLLTGRGEGGMKIDQIILSENVNVGDIVQTDVLGTNLVIGVIGEIIVRKGEMFKSALVKRQYNPEELETVFLVKK
jgi:cell shape-determining protein MreC